MQFTAAFLSLVAVIGINPVVAGPACGAAAFRPVPKSFANLTPEQELNVYNQIRSTWSNKTLDLENQLFAQRNDKAIGKRCNSCSGNLDFAICVTTCGGQVVNGPSEQCVAGCACEACQQCSDWIICPDCCE